jgi:hypothetical protein
VIFRVDFLPIIRSGCHCCVHGVEIRRFPSILWGFYLLRVLLGFLSEIFCSISSRWRCIFFPHLKFLLVDETIVADYTLLFCFCLQCLSTSR